MNSRDYNCVIGLTLMLEYFNYMTSTNNSLSFALTITPVNNIQFLDWLIRFSGFLLIKAKDSELFIDIRNVNIKLATIYNKYVMIEH